MSLAAINQGLEWVCPELLSSEYIKNELNIKLNIKAEELHKLDKHELVELYYTHISPLPQRKYRLNRRGREMTKKQIIQAKKRKPISMDVDYGPTPEKRKFTSASLGISPSSTCDRLKPPPSAVNVEKKTIRLGSGSTSTSQTLSPISTSLNRLKLTKNDTSSLSQPKKIKLNNSNADSTSLSLKKTMTVNSNSNSNATSNETQSKDGSTDQSSDVVTSSSEPMDTSETAVPQEKKVKLKRIAWP